MEDLHCLLYQTDIAWNQAEANRRHYEAAFLELPENCDLVAFPETCISGFQPRSLECAESPDGESSRFFRQWAERKNTAIVAGLSIRENGKAYNRLLWTDPGQSLHYDKRHLFRMGGETELYTPGTQSCVVTYKGWRFLLRTCYDLRFPLSCRNRYENGRFLYDVLIVAANWPASRKEAFQTLAKARAIENQAYVLLVNRVGHDSEGVFYSGNSLIIDYKGQVMASLPEAEEGFLSATLSRTGLDRFRENFPNHLDWEQEELPACPTA